MPQAPRRRTQRPASGNGPRTHHTTDPEKDIDQKREAFLAARKDYEEAVIANKMPKTVREDLHSFAKMAVRGGVRVTAGIINAGARIGDSVERDIRRNSLEGQIDQTMIRAIFERNKTSTSKTKGKTPRPDQFTVVMINGKPVMVNDKDIQKKRPSRRSRY